MISALEGLAPHPSINPLESFHFMLRVEAVYDLPCKSVKAFSKENEYEYIQEGGLNDYVHMRRKPVSKPFTFEVERYVAVDYFDPLQNGAELILPVILFVSHEGGQFISHVARVYTFTGCVVTGKQYGQLDSESSGLLLETTTIAYRELAVVDLPGNRQEPLSDDQSVGKTFRKAKRLFQPRAPLIKWDKTKTPPVTRAAHPPSTEARVRRWKG